MTISPPPAAPSGTPLRATLEAAFRLARFDRTALALFDGSVAGFWQSYRAAFLIAPIELGLVVAGVPEDQDPLMPLVVGGLIFVIQWLLMPVIWLAIAERIGRGDRVLRFLVAYNWISLPQNVALVIGRGFAMTAGVHPGTAFLLIFSSTAYALALVWFIARTGLDVSGRIAAYIVAIDMTVSIALGLISWAVRYS